MSDLDKLLELTRDARGRWRTVRATLRDWEDVPRAREAWNRLATTPNRLSDGSQPESEASPQFAIAMRRVWARKPCRWRLEFEGPDGSNVFVGDLAWTEPPEAPRADPVTAASDMLDLEVIDGSVAYTFDPWLVVPRLAMRILGHTEYAGREVVRVAGVAEEGAQDTILGPYADDYELLVDAERGTLLRSAARIEDKEFKSTEILDIAFDEDLPEDLFIAEDIFTDEPPSET